MNNIGLGQVDENYELASILSGGATPPFMDTASVASGGGSSFNWGSSLTKGIDTGLQVFKDVYGGVQPGTFVKTPQGGIIQRLPTGSPTATFGTFPSVGSSSVGDIIMWGGLAVVGVFIASKMFGGK